jgi:hypothetical protein
MNRNNEQLTAKIIQFPQKIHVSERAIKLGVLTAYLGAKQDIARAQILKMLLDELSSRNIDTKPDISDIQKQISAGFELYKNNPGLACEEVFHQALEHYHLMVR